MVGFEDLAIGLGGRKQVSPLLGLVEPVLLAAVGGFLGESEFEDAGFTVLDVGPRVGDWGSALDPLANFLSNLFFVGDWGFDLDPLVDLLPNLFSVGDLA